LDVLRTEDEYNTRQIVDGTKESSNAPSPYRRLYHYMTPINIIDLLPMYIQKIGTEGNRPLKMPRL
jgi:hypothetical protein